MLIHCIAYFNAKKQTKSKSDYGTPIRVRSTKGFLNDSLVVSRVLKERQNPVK